MNIDFTNLLVDAIVVLIASLTVLVATEIVPRAQKLWKPFKTAYPLEADFLERQAEIGVKAAEQYVDGPGQEKLGYALDYVESQAQKYGYDFDKGAVRVMIEAKVKDLENQFNTILSTPH